MENKGSDQQAERYCPLCGKSTQPLDVPHVSKDCSDCGRTIYFVRPGDDGHGIKVEAGERFTIPAGFIKLSLQPTPNAKLTRAGIPFLVNQFFAGSTPTEHSIVEFVSNLEQEFDAYIDACPKAQGRDWKTEEDGVELCRLFGEDKLSRDWHMFSASMFCSGVKWSIDAKNASRAAWAGYMLGTMRGLSIVSEPLFEETLWRGYLANEVVYEAAAAAGSRSSAEIEALRKLQPLFAQFDEATLTALVDSGVPIGPKIGVKSLPEELLRALAKHQIVTLERTRQDAKNAELAQLDEERHRRQEKRQDLELRVKWAGFGAAAAMVVVSAIALAMKAAPQGTDKVGVAAQPSTALPLSTPASAALVVLLAHPQGGASRP